tara:strand:+ start:6577 stop:7536 length:960 start_codon:yes stop_codon:yes gene_type:complete
MHRCLLPLFVLVVASCDAEQAPVRHEPVVVYADNSDGEYLDELFAGFTAASKIPVTVELDSSANHAKNLIFNIGSPPADVFLSSSVADLWAAADEGALRPIMAVNLAQVPEPLRDADKLWTALRFQQSIIVHRSNAAELPADVDEFANRRYQGRICLGTSELPTNRLLLAMLIDLHGRKETERMVRHWMQNLAAAPFQDEQELLDAVASGECEFAIVSGWQAASSLHSQADIGVQVIEPATSYIQIQGIGVARHSRYPDAAQALVQWLLDEQVNQRHAEAVGSIPVVGREFTAGVGPAPAVAGWRDEEAKLLAERAGYR